MTQCLQCSRKDGSIAFECLDCCIRWLSRMSGAARQINAPVIEKVMGKDHMEKVRQAWKERK